jgi:hypothetical protein
VRADSRGVRLDSLRRERAAVGIGEPGRLIGHRGHDAFAAVADVHDHGAAGRVQVAATVGVPDLGVAGTDGDDRVRIGGAAEDAAGG